MHRSNTKRNHAAGVILSDNLHAYIKTKGIEFVNRLSIVAHKINKRDHCISGLYVFKDKKVIKYTNKLLISWEK